VNSSFKREYMYITTLGHKCASLKLDETTLMKPKTGFITVLTYIQEAKNFLKKKRLWEGLSYSTPQKSEETRGNTITQPRSHPIKKM